ncbi:NADPH-dependent FMN reductase [Paenibacillus assamensis]|uniref:NADPH-dependent FMN reductase n=1 Tax=Paenibacillus assamensis TaxID=311244 RepID=UPI0003F969DD|nr:NADPH-dependent FMN reductase [Paenibacillus assamensis]
MTQLLLISGSPRKGSNSSKVIRHVQQQLEAAGATCKVFDLNTDKLPLYEYDQSQYELEIVRKLVQQVHEADGYVICTPEYHGAMSGALKNALDFLGGKDFSGKPCAIAATAGGGKGGINALNNLRTVLRSLYVNTLPNQIIADPNVFNEEGQVTEERTANGLGLLAEQLIAEVKLRKS